MSVVIVGGNECMVRQYMDLCRQYRCRAKVYPKKTDALSQSHRKPGFAGTIYKHSLSYHGALRPERGEGRPDAGGAEPLQFHGSAQTGTGGPCALGNGEAHRR